MADDRPLTSSCSGATRMAVSEPWESGYWSRKDLEEELEKWKQRDAGKLREFCQVAIYVLEKKLRKRKA